MAIRLATKTLKQMAKQYSAMQKGHDFKEPLRAGAKLVSANNTRRFSKQVDPNGKRWKPLSKAYEKRKLKKHKGKRSNINVDTGILFQSITSNSDAAAYYNLQRDRVTFGSKVHYGEHVQKARPFIGMSKDDLKEVQELFDIWLEKLYLKNGRR